VRNSHWRSTALFSVLELEFWRFIYVIDVFETALESKNCRILLVVDSIEHIPRNRIGDFMRMLGLLLTGKLRKMCSVLLGGQTISYLKENLQGVPFVNQDTEVNGMIHPDKSYPCIMLILSWSAYNRSTTMAIMLAVMRLLLPLASLTNRYGIIQRGKPTHQVS